MGMVRFLVRIDDRSVLLDDELEYVVGRGSDCQIVLDDLLVSRKHATMRIDDDGVFVQDLGSRNGVKVNNVPITGETRLRHGDRLQIGNKELLLHDIGREQMKTWPSGPAVPKVANLDETMPRLDVATQSGDSVFGLLLQVCDTAFRNDRLDDAEVAVKYLVSSIEDTLRRGNKLDTSVCSQAVEHCFTMAGRTHDGIWLDRVLALHRIQRKVPGSQAIATLAEMRPRAHPSQDSLRGFLAAVDTDELSADDRSRLQELRGALHA